MYLPIEAALDFSPLLSQRVEMKADIYPALSSLTLSAWVKTKIMPESGQRFALAGRGYAQAGCGGFGLEMRAENESVISFHTRYYETVVTADYPYPDDGLWHHVAGVRDASGQSTRLYLDGELVAETVGALTSLSGNGRIFALGARYAPSDKYNFFYDGQLAEVRLWNYARSTEKIDRERYYKMRGDEPGLIGYWPCDEGLDVRVYDGTSSSNNGIFVSSVAWEYTVDFMRDRPPPGILLFLH
jgi:hypothetical protein